MHADFSNIVRSEDLERIAAADEHEVKLSAMDDTLVFILSIVCAEAIDIGVGVQVVREVQEFYADYLAVNPHAVSLGIVGCIGDTPTSWKRSVFERVREGVVSLLLSLQKRPLIRYDG